MLAYTIIVAALSSLALAAPSTDLSARQEEIQKCCFTLDNVNKPTFITTGDGDFLDTLNWCFLNVKRDPTDPNNCSKATAQISSGYCTAGDKGIVIDCPAS
ncbi:uncharacterized protein BKCO1_990004 [Diplodia corticola]|uniref:Uncharacterized protein n=1 Tax=Diplodia corticola TaxID=236234 RepID=A0A1J9QKJ3_9PEZI|nr:uncharacterized protein BKCO1_990004 [Diplodia corticola]OJD28993.1 hypothetical protein BKCO1_990004 [Diplodia corticola]